MTLLPPTPSYHLTQTLRGHTASLSSLAFSHSGYYLASASADRTLKIWDITTTKAQQQQAKIEQTLTGHTLGINDLAWSFCDGYVCTASDDKSIRIWEMKSVRYTHLGSERDGKRMGDSNWNSE